MKIRTKTLVKLFLYSVLASGITYALMATGAFENVWKYLFFSIGLFVLVGLDMSRDQQLRALQKHLIELDKKAEIERIKNSREHKLDKQFKEGGYNYWEKDKDK